VNAWLKRASVLETLTFSLNFTVTLPRRMAANIIIFIRKLLPNTFQLSLSDIFRTDAHRCQRHHWILVYSKQRT